MYVDFKVTGWERVQLDDMHQDELIRLLKSGEIRTSNDVVVHFGDEDAHFAGVQADSETTLTIEENKGHATIELLLDDGEGNLWDNASNQLAEVVANNGGELVKRALRFTQMDREIAEKKVKIKQEEIDKKKSKIEENFKEAFKDVLHLLEEAKISWSGQVDESQTDGRYVEFKRGQQIVKMDFHNQGSYRYEFTIHGHGSMTYGQWGMDKFIVWICKEFNLIQ